MTLTLLFLMILHVALLNVDEYYFHRKRQLCRLEVYSLLIDGALYLIPLGIAIFAPISDSWKLLYIAFATLSCLSVAKNEWFYHHIEKKERTLHALLYLLHPILLYSFYLSWVENYFVHNLNFWIIQICYLGFGFKTLSYQIIYWNYVRTDCE